MNRIEGNRFRSRHGRCYELAGKWLLNEGDARGCRLVHGDLYGRITVDPATGRPWPDAHVVKRAWFDHAWIEHNGKIYEPNHNVWIEGADLLRWGKRRVKHRYTRRQMARLLAKHGHWGPW